MCKVLSRRTAPITLKKTRIVQMSLEDCARYFTFGQLDDWFWWFDFFSFSELKVALHWDMSFVLLSSLHWYVLGIIQLFYVQWTISIMVDNQCNGRGPS